MEFLTRAYAPLAELLKSMTVGARLTAATLLIVAVASMAYLFNDQVAGGDTYLMGGEVFSSAQLRSMHAALGKAGVEARVDGARIKVPRIQQSKAMAALAEANALPVEFGAYLEKAVTGGGLMSLNRNQTAAIKIAKQRELQGIINTMVEKSAVLIDEQSDHGFPPKTILTASVSIQPRDNQPLDDSPIPAGIRTLMVHSVVGLRPEAVTVIDLNTGRAYTGTGSGDGKSPGALGDYAELKRYHEREFQRKISHVLAYIPGVLVTTSVELDREISHEQTSIEYDTAAGDEAGAANDAISRAQSPRGAAGVLQKAARGLAGDDEAAPRAVEHRLAPSTQKHIVREGRTPQRVAVSVAVPSDYYEKIWRQINATAAQPLRRPDPVLLADIQAAEKQKIEELVTALLPRQEGDPIKQVAVSTFYQFPEPALGTPPLKEQVMSWLAQNGAVLGLAGLAVVGLLVLRSIVKAVAAYAAARPARAANPGGVVSAFTSAGESAGQPDGSARQRLRRRAAAEPSLREELSEVVREDPQAAVSILRSWIGNAG